MTIGSIKKYRPITASLRHTIRINTSGLDICRYKYLLNPYKKHAGRNFTGKLLVRHRGGCVKRQYRQLDYNYNLINIPGRIETIEYDPVRTAFVSLILYDNGLCTYKITTHNTKQGDPIILSKKIRFDLGSSNELRYLPEGSLIHNIEHRPDRGSSIARSAGTYGILLSKLNNVATIRLPSKQIKEFSLDCRATVGMVSNIYHRDTIIGKAGRSRLLGKRPTVRGVAMNPIDHPHGGGEGKRSNKKEVYNYTGRVIRGRSTSNKLKYKTKVRRLHRINL